MNEYGLFETQSQRPRIEPEIEPEINQQEHFLINEGFISPDEATGMHTEDALLLILKEKFGYR